MTDITACRIIQTRYSQDTTTINGVSIPGAFSGFGAKEFGGRWNNKGTPVVYAAGSQSLAILEVAVHVESENQLKNYSLFEVTFDDSLVTTLPQEQWPDDWQNDPAPSSTKKIGDEWVASQDSLILQVPSTIVTDTPNFIINPYHPDLHKLQISGAIPYPIDSRIKKTS